MSCPHTNQTPAAKTGILLVNLGTPEAPTPKALRKYLKQFLSDTRVIDLPRALWLPILYGPVLTFRPKKVAKAYASIWNHEADESPLLTTTKAQTKAVEALLDKEHFTVTYAMRYGHPSIAEGLDALRKAGANSLRILPLYPQYAGATSGTVADDVARWILQEPWVPEVHILGPYHDHPDYITALKTSTERQLKEQNFTPEVLITSFHGLPTRYCKNGDVYYCHCHKTARLLAENLGYHFVADWEKEGLAAAVKAAKQAKKPLLIMAFQSRFGPEQWLTPATDTTINTCAEHGLKTTVTMPGFAADCLETLEEIGIAGKEDYIEHGGKPEDYTTLTCLNDEKGHTALIGKLVMLG